MLPNLGTLDDSHIAVLAPGQQDEIARCHPERPALELVVAGDCVGIVEAGPTHQLHPLLLDPLEVLGQDLHLPAEHLARARWERRHPFQPWTSLTGEQRAFERGRAASELAAAARLAAETPTRVRVLVDDPSAAERAGVGHGIRVWLDDLEITTSAALVVES